MNVLIAEDDRVQNRLLERHLETKGHQVQVVFDAEAAWRAVEKSPPDVILLDLLMPGGTGLGLLKKIRSASGFPKLPVVVVTGMEDAMVRRMAEQQGVDSIFSKPVDLMLLDVTLESVRSQLPPKPAGTPGR